MIDVQRAANKTCGKGVEFLRSAAGFRVSEKQTYSINLIFQHRICHRSISLNPNSE